MTFIGWDKMLHDMHEGKIVRAIQIKWAWQNPPLEKQSYDIH